MSKIAMQVCIVILLVSNGIALAGREKKSSRAPNATPEQREKEAATFISQLTHNKVDNSNNDSESEHEETPALPESPVYHDACDQVVETNDEEAMYAEPIGPEPEPVAPKSSCITGWMKAACFSCSNLVKAEYYLENTANRDAQTSKEIGSRIGDAISETIAQIEKLNRTEVTIQMADAILAKKQEHIKTLEKVLQMALEGPEPVEIDSGLLIQAGKMLKNVNQEHKDQVERTVKKSTTCAHSNKALAFLIRKRLQDRGNYELSGENLSSRTYENEYDLLTYVGQNTKVD